MPDTLTTADVWGAPPAKTMSTADVWGAPPEPPRHPSWAGVQPPEGESFTPRQKQYMAAVPTKLPELRAEAEALRKQFREHGGLGGPDLDALAKLDNVDIPAASQPPSDEQIAMMRQSFHAQQNPQLPASHPPPFQRETAARPELGSRGMGDWDRVGTNILAGLGLAPDMLTGLVSFGHVHLFQARETVDAMAKMQAGGMSLPSSRAMAATEGVSEWLREIIPFLVPSGAAKLAEFAGLGKGATGAAQFLANPALGAAKLAGGIPGVGIPAGFAAYAATSAFSGGAGAGGSAKAAATALPDFIGQISDGLNSAVETLADFSHTTPGQILSAMRANDTLFTILALGWAGKHPEKADALTGKGLTSRSAFKDPSLSFMKGAPENERSAFIDTVRRADEFYGPEGKMAQLALGSKMEQGFQRRQAMADQLYQNEAPQAGGAPASPGEGPLPVEPQQRPAIPAANVPGTEGQTASPLSVPESPQPIPQAEHPIMDALRSRPREQLSREGFSSTVAHTEGEIGEQRQGVNRDIESLGSVSAVAEGYPGNTPVERYARAKAALMYIDGKLDLESDATRSRQPEFVGPPTPGRDQMLGHPNDIPDKPMEYQPGEPLDDGLMPSVRGDTSARDGMLKRRPSKPYKLEGEREAEKAAKAAEAEKAKPAEPVAAEKAGGFFDFINKVARPARRTLQSLTSADVNRVALGKMVQSVKQSEEVGKAAVASYDKMPVDRQLATYDDVETGRNVPADLRPLRDIREQLWKEVSAIKGGAQTWIENYLPHLWEKSDAPDFAQRLLAKSPLRGPATFLKQRTIPTLKEGIDAGFTPAETNPARAELLKIRELLRFKYAHELTSGLGERGLRAFVAHGERAPDGYRFGSEIAPGRPDPTDVVPGKGRYAYPEPVAQVLDIIRSKGLRGNKVFDAVDGVGSLAIAAKLGISAFHFFFTGIADFGASTGLGLKDVATGRGERGLKLMAKGSTFGTADALSGGALKKLYLAQPGELTEAQRAIIEPLVMAGSRVSMYDLLRQSPLGRMLSAGRQGDKLGVAKNAPGAALYSMSYPLMQKWVPNLKLGVGQMMVQRALDALPEGASFDRKVRAAAEAWDNVDSLLGQVAHDNVIAHRTLKDLTHMATLAPGWTIGSLKLAAGAIKDVFTTSERVREQGWKEAISDRQAMTFGIAGTAMLMGGLTQYLFTGKWPDKMKDYFFPLTGGTRPDGTPERVSLPTYARDAWAWLHDPVTTAEHKLHPALGIVSEMVKNQTYHGEMVHNPDDPWMKQVGQFAKYAGKQFEPFSIQGIQKARESGASWPAAMTRGGLATEAPASMSQSDAYKIGADYLRSQGKPPITPEEAEQKEYRRDLVNQARANPEAGRAAISASRQAGDIGPSMAKSMVKRSMRSPIEAMTAAQSIPLPVAVKMWEAAEKGERTDALRKIIIDKWTRERGFMPKADREAMLSKLESSGIVVSLKKAG